MFYSEVVISIIGVDVEWLPTLDQSCVVAAQHDVHHEGELRCTLTERLNEPQHAKVMGQINCILRPTTLSPPHSKTLPDS